jgi:hypothetical protein
VVKKYIEVGPAYGRDYKSSAAALADWDANKDFTVYEGGPYGIKTNKSDCDAMDVRVIIRYNRKQDVCKAFD